MKRTWLTRTEMESRYPPATVNLWVGNWGEIRLPDDFPSLALRVDGWFDKRFGIYPKLVDYLQEQDDKLRIGRERPGFTAPSFITWMQCGSVPNRLHGATVNAQGDVI